MKFAMILLLSAISIGCGYGSGYNAMTGGALPQIAQLSPSQVTAGGSAFNLTVKGTGFSSDAVVYWGTTALASSTTYNSTTQVTAAISAPMVANSGTVSVYVHTSAGNSNSMTFTIM